MSNNKNDSHRSVKDQKYFALPIDPVVYGGSKPGQVPYISRSFNIGDLVSVDGCLGEYKVVKSGSGDILKVSNTIDGSQIYVRKVDCKHLSQSTAIQSIQVGDRVRVDSLHGEWTVTHINNITSEATVENGVARHTIPRFYCNRLDPIPSTGWSTYIPAFWDTESNNPFSGSIKLDKDHGIFPEKSKAPACECGTSKTYGENCSSDLHSLWCKLYKKV